jgi:hypothetical protein
LPSRIFIYLFLFPNSSGLENYVIYERLCVKACNIYLNLNYACFLCHDIIYLIHVNFMQICIFECLKCNDEYFLVNMLSLEKPDCLILANLAYVSLILFVVILLSCASHNSCSHTQIVAQIRCIHIGGALLDFLEKCVKWHLCAKFEFHSICTYLGGANTICMDPKLLLKILCKL